LRPHAKGGLGEVFIAEDLELHRTIALKEIQKDHANEPQSRSRFEMEAKVTGGLEHPGVVPVYGLGHYKDGRPFYAMRLIRGETLKEAAQRFHATDMSGRDPGERARALRELLQRFIGVCNAVAYAHSRSVLHRDLKPANVMLGPFGETLVVDWGLAKPIDQTETGDSEASELRRSLADARGTQMGVAIGTPAYMSPEQAAGRQDLLGPASDVYSLGATLYFLLTGSPPFQAGSVQQVLRQVQAGDFPPPREVNRKVPVGLEAICLKAMAREVADRYPSALALAEDVDHWLADEPVAARREPWWERVLRLCRRRPVLAGWIGFGLAENLALIIALAGVLLWAFGVVIKPLWLNGLVFAPFLGFVWIVEMAAAMSFFAQWLGLVGLVAGFVLANYVAILRRKRGRKWVARAALLVAKVGLAFGALLGYVASGYLLDRIAGTRTGPRSVLMWIAICAWGTLPLVGIGFGLLRRANWEPRRKKVKQAAITGVVTGAMVGFTLFYVDLIQRPPASQLSGRDSPGSLASDRFSAQLNAAKTELEAAKTELQQNLREHPTYLSPRYKRASHYLFGAATAKNKGQSQEELDSYAKAMDELEPLFRAKLFQPGFQELLVSCYRGRADALARLGRSDEELKDWDRALELDCWTPHQEMRLRRALSLAKIGDHTQAVNEMIALKPARNLPRAALYMFAQVYAVAAAKTGPDQALSERYGSQAVAMLALAKEAGYFNEPKAVDRLKHDADFESLRLRKDFNELLGGR
jgi:tRNA A-37 threonylcarbamoyl transferase component Bud32